MRSYLELVACAQFSLKLQGVHLRKKSFILSFWCLFKELTTSVAIKLVDTVESPGANLVSNIAFRGFIPLWETTEC